MSAALADGDLVDADAAAPVLPTPVFAAPGWAPVRRMRVAQPFGFVEVGAQVDEEDGLEVVHDWT